MGTTCTRCDNSGFLNIDQVDDDILKRFDKTGEVKVILDWIEARTDHDVSVCDCCGNGDEWYGVRGEHYNADDQPGRDGPYEYNGGLCECH